MCCNKRRFDEQTEEPGSDVSERRALLNIVVGDAVDGSEFEEIRGRADESGEYLCYYATDDRYY